MDVPTAIGPCGEPGRAASAGQLGGEDHVDLAGLRQRQDLLAFGALLLCPLPAITTGTHRRPSVQMNLRTLRTHAHDFAAAAIAA
jgi:hypothetical protein